MAPERVGVVDLRHRNWTLAVAFTRRGLCFIGLPGTPREDLARFVSRAIPGAREVRAEETPDGAVSQLRAYLDGDLRTFRLRLDMRGTAFQKDVWSALCEIPYGETHTYGELARAVGRPGASRAVGSALGANPVAIVVPCHRIVAKGGIGGYGGGLVTKRRLLALEGVQIPTPP